jgi:hypothetical protein
MVRSAAVKLPSLGKASMGLKGGGAVSGLGAGRRLRGRGGDVLALPD